MLYREIIAVCSEIHTKHKWLICNNSVTTQMADLQQQCHNSNGWFATTVSQLKWLICHNTVTTQNLWFFRGNF